MLVTCADHHPNPNSRSSGRWASFSRVQRKRPMVTITKETSLMLIEETCQYVYVYVMLIEETCQGPAEPK